MSLSPIQIVTAICPNLSASPSCDVFIEMAETELDRCFFGTLWARAVALKASHMFVLSQRSLGESGSVSSKSEGHLSLSFSSNVGSDDLDQTSYGKELQSLIAKSGASVSVVGGDSYLGECT
jgi:hypothetical protein